MRWLKFNAVGALGMAVQLAVLTFLVHVAGLHYLAATALAVEAAVIHNFAWHRRWTWADREAAPLGTTFLRFNLTTGAVSIGGNLVAMAVLVGEAGLEPIPANLASIALCALVNYLVCDHWVFLGSAGVSGRRPRFMEGTAHAMQPADHPRR